MCFSFRAPRSKSDFIRLPAGHSLKSSEWALGSIHLVSKPLPVAQSASGLIAGAGIISTATLTVLAPSASIAATQARIPADSTPSSICTTPPQRLATATSGPASAVATHTNLPLPFRVSLEIKETIPTIFGYLPAWSLKIHTIIMNTPFVGAAISPAAAAVVELTITYAVRPAV